MKTLIVTHSPLLFFLLVGYAPVSALAVSDHCQSALFTDKSLSQETDQLSIYSRVFWRVHCDVLLRGEYIINTPWMDERGKLRTERHHKFHLGLPRSYSAVFKFKKMPLGSLNRLASGKDFDEHQYGRWSVLTFINGEEIDKKYFIITE